MTLAREVRSLEDLAGQLTLDDGIIGSADARLLNVTPYGYDDRIDWHTHIVTYDGGAIGFTNGPLTRAVD